MSISHITALCVDPITLSVQCVCVVMRVVGGWCSVCGTAAAHTYTTSTSTGYKHVVAPNPVHHFEFSRSNDSDKVLLSRVSCYCVIKKTCHTDLVKKHHVRFQHKTVLQRITHHGSWRTSKLFVCFTTKGKDAAAAFISVIDTTARQTWKEGDSMRFHLPRRFGESDSSRM
jgi:hypothetical protein